jgi:hypothetical protein
VGKGANVAAGRAVTVAGLLVHRPVEVAEPALEEEIEGVALGCV